MVQLIINHSKVSSGPKSIYITAAQISFQKHRIDGNSGFFFSQMFASEMEKKTIVHPAFPNKRKRTNRCLKI